MKQYLLYHCCVSLPLLEEATRRISRTYFQRQNIASGLHLSPGTPHRQAIYLDELSQLPTWAGRQHHLSELPLAGNGQIIVKDVASGQCIYKTSFLFTVSGMAVNRRSQRNS